MTPLLSSWRGDLWSLRPWLYFWGHGSGGEPSECLPHWGSPAVIQHSPSCQLRGEKGQFGIPV